MLYLYVGIQPFSLDEACEMSLSISNVNTTDLFFQAQFSIANTNIFATFIDMIYAQSSATTNG